MITLKKNIQVQTIFSAFEPVYESNFKYEGERHNFWELVYVVDGYAGVIEDERVYNLSAGDIIFHMPMEFHRFWAEKNTNLHLIIISFSLVGTGTEFLGSGIFRLNEEKKTLLIGALEASCYCDKFDNEIKNQLISNNLERLILKIIDENTESNRLKKSVGDRNYKTIIEVMNQNINKKLTINEIAELSNLSVSNLKKIFRRYSGMGVIEYFNRLKINEALKLLEEDMTINEISDLLGFSSSSYFCDSFKKHCGTSPMKYRKEYKNSTYYFSRQRS